MFRLLSLSVAIACSVAAAEAHEFWVIGSPTQIDVDDPLIATLHVGQEFKGGSMSYLPPSFRKFTYFYNGEETEVPGRIGDRPAVNMPAPGEGLVVLVHVTTNNTVTWTTWERFESFALHKDSPQTLEAHRARGLPEQGFTEVYSRYAKALIGVGDSAGQDREFGLLTEIVALENPYTDDMSDGIDVSLLYQGAPRADEQIEVFEKAADDTVTITTLRTDAEGRATIPVKPGMTYMLDAVVLREPTPALMAEENAVWESLWANITFSVPDA